MLERLAKIAAAATASFFIVVIIMMFVTIVNRPAPAPTVVAFIGVFSLFGAVCSGGAALALIVWAWAFR